MTSETKPGWYVLNTGNEGHPISAVEVDGGGGFWRGGCLLNELLPGWTLGARIDDLLRDAAENAQLLRREHDEVCAHLAEYEEKLREARRDAERYLHLRKHAAWVAGNMTEPEIDVWCDAEIAHEKERADE